MRPSDQSASDLDQPTESSSVGNVPNNQAAGEVEPSTTAQEPASEPSATSVDPAPSETNVTTQPTPPASPDPVAASPFANPVVPSPSPIAPAPKNKRKLILAIIIIVVLALLGGAAALVSWYQNPDKVVLDSLINTVKAEKVGVTGTAGLTSDVVDVTVDLTSRQDEKIGDAKADITLKVKSGEFANQEFTVTADSVAVKDGEGYFRISNLEKALDSFVNSFAKSYAEQYRKMGYTITDSQEAQLRTQLKSQFSGIVSKLDNQWIKFSADDLTNDKDDTSTCVTDAFKKISEDKKVSGEVLDVYKKNSFLSVKENLGTKDGSFGYLLELDEAAAKKFGKEVENTEFGKELVKCDSDIFKDSTSSTDKSEDTVKNGRFELWVDQWSHRITRVVASGESPDSVSTKMKISGDFKLDYNVKTDDIKVPENAKSIKDIEADIKSLTGSTGIFSSET